MGPLQTLQGQLKKREECLSSQIMKKCTKGSKLRTRDRTSVRRILRVRNGNHLVTASFHHTSSRKVAAPLVSLILQQSTTYPTNCKESQKEPTVQQAAQLPMFLLSVADTHLIYPLLATFPLVGHIPI